MLTFISMFAKMWNVKKKLNITRHEVTTKTKWRSEYYFKFETHCISPHLILIFFPSYIHPAVLTMRMLRSSDEGVRWS